MKRKHHEPTLEEHARQAGQKARHIIDGTTGEVTEFVETVETRVQQKPVQSSLIALGVGVLIGLFLRRK